MADLIAYQDGNFTGATTWKGVATSTGARQTSFAASTLSTTSYVYSPTFTVTNGVVIEGVMLLTFRNNTSGTFSVALSDDNGVTATREVTVNASAIGANFQWTFFKFDTALTGDGGTDYKLGIKSSVASNLSVYRSSTTADWTRYLRTDSTATIATTDVPFIVPNLGNSNAVTNIAVTMDSTANTSYGVLHIANGCSLSYGTSASTNYYLRLAGNLVVQAGGTFNIGTSGTRIPSTSTATLEFNCSTNVQFGLELDNGSTVNIYGAEKKSWTLLTSTANSGQAVAIVQDTTGWLANDEVILPTTTNIRTDSDRRTIASVDSATQITLSSNLSFTHSGVTNYQGEVGNLTRNVKIRGTSATLQSYVNCAATSSFTADNAEFFFLGSGTTNKRGIDSATTSSGTFLMNGCALRDFSVTNNICVNATGTTGSPSISRCVMVQGQASLIAIGATSGVPIIFQNLTIQTTNAAGVSLSDVGGEVTENRFVAGNPAIAINEASVINIFSNNVIHSSQSGGTNNGFTINNCTGGTIESCDVWRVGTGNGFNVNARITLNNCRSYHNSLANLIANNDLKVTNSVFDGGTGQSIGVSNRHIDVNGSDIVFENCDFGQTNQATNFINVTVIGGDATFINCDIAESLTPLNQSNLFSPTNTPIIGLDKLNSTSGNHRAYKRFGYAGSDQSVYRTASPSEVLVPNSASGKLPSGSKKFGVASGNDATVSVWVRKSSTYNGNEPRLILKRNIVGGVSSDQVLDTASAPAVVNLLSSPQSFDDAVWVKTGTTITANTTETESPVGDNSAEKATKTTTGETRIRQTTSQASSTQYTLSCYAKKGSVNFLRLRNIAVGDNNNAWFNLDNGTVGTLEANVTSASISSVGNGWYRCSIVGTTQSTITNNLVDIAVAPADNAVTGGTTSDTIYLWGAQLNTGSSPTDGTWEELTASTPTVTDDCVLEVYVDCDGTAGTVNVDDYSIS